MPAISKIIAGMARSFELILPVFTLPALNVSADMVCSCERITPKNWPAAGNEMILDITYTRA